jgi:hypothetical protein
VIGVIASNRHERVEVEPVVGAPGQLDAARRQREGTLELVTGDAGHVHTEVGDLGARIAVDLGPQLEPVQRARAGGEAGQVEFHLHGRDDHVFGHQQPLSVVPRRSHVKAPEVVPQLRVVSHHARW